MYDFIVFMPSLSKTSWWGLFAFLGLVGGLLPKEKLFHLKNIILFFSLIWIFVFLQIRYSYLGFNKILFEYSLPQFLFFIVPFRLANYFTKSESIELKREITSKVENDLRIKIEKEYKTIYPSISSANFEIISGKDHIAERKQAINQARKSLVITSGWVSKYVVDSDFLDDLQSALDRGVHIGLVYGYEDSFGKHNSDKESIILLDDFALRNDKKPFKIIRKANHSKILIVDKEYAICGSFNWLSNNMAKNEECSFKSKDKGLIKELWGSLEKLS